MRKGLDVLMRNNKNASVKEIEGFLEECGPYIADKSSSDIDIIFKTYLADVTTDKWIYNGLTNYIFPLKAYEMLIITKTLRSYSRTISDLRNDGVDVMDVILFMHNMYSVYYGLTLKSDEVEWGAFIHVIVGGNALADTIEYSVEKTKHYTFNDEVEKKDYYAGLLDVLRLDNFDKTKLYIDYSLSE